MGKRTKRITESLGLKSETVRGTSDFKEYEGKKKNKGLYEQELERTLGVPLEVAGGRHRMLRGWEEEFDKLCKWERGNVHCFINAQGDVFWDSVKRFINSLIIKERFRDKNW